jgi:cell division protein FtsL
LLVAKKRQPEISYYDRQRARKRIEARQVNNLHSAGVKLKMFGALFACMLLAIALIAHFTYVVNVSHKIDAGMNELKALQDEGKHLKLEIASLQSPQRLEKMGLEIGLQYPDKDQFIVLTAGVTGN